MFELIIKKSDGNVYWKEYANKEEALIAWLDVEKTRSYWKADYTYEIIDRTPPPPSQAELDAIETRNAQIRSLKNRVKSLTSQPDMTASEVKEALMKFLKSKELSGELD